MRTTMLRPVRIVLTLTASAASEDKKLVVPDRAVHGSSMLVPDRNPGAGAIWPEVVVFLEPFRR